MFALSYQTGKSGVEVLSSNGKDPLRPDKKLAKLTGNGSRLYDRSAKGYVFNLGSGASSCLQCPATSRQTLGLTQRFMVLQLKFSPGKQASISFEVAFLDQDGRRRRLHFSSHFRSFEPLNELSAQIPLNPTIYGENWANMILDLEDLATRAFPGCRFGSVDSILLKPHCHLRKIFTLPVFDEENPVINHTFDFIKGTIVAPNQLFRIIDHDMGRKRDKNHNREPRTPIHSEATGTTAATSTSTMSSRSSRLLSANSSHYSTTSGGRRIKSKSMNASPFKNTASRLNEKERARYGIIPTTKLCEDSDVTAEVQNDKLDKENLLVKLPSPAGRTSEDLDRVMSKSPKAAIKAAVATSKFHDVRISPSSPIIVNNLETQRETNGDNTLDVTETEINESPESSTSPGSLTSTSFVQVDTTNCTNGSSSRRSSSNENVNETVTKTESEAKFDLWKDLRKPVGDKASKWAFLTSGSLDNKSQVDTCVTPPTEPVVQSMISSDHQISHENMGVSDNLNNSANSSETGSWHEESIRHDFGDNESPRLDCSNLSMEGAEFYDDLDQDEENLTEKSFQHKELYEIPVVSLQLNVREEATNGVQAVPTLDSEWSAETYSGDHTRISWDVAPDEGHRGLVSSLERLDLMMDDLSTIPNSHTHEISDKQKGGDVSVESSVSSDGDMDRFNVYDFIAQKNDIDKDCWTNLEELEQEFETVGHAINGVLGPDEVPKVIENDTMARLLVDNIQDFSEPSTLHNGRKSWNASSATTESCKNEPSERPTTAGIVAGPMKVPLSTFDDSMNYRKAFPLRAPKVEDAQFTRLSASRMSTNTIRACLDDLQENIREEEHKFLEEFGAEEFDRAIGLDSYEVSVL